MPARRVALPPGFNLAKEIRRARAYGRSHAAALSVDWLADEYESAAVTGLAIALDRWNPARGSIGPWIRRKVKSEVKDLKRAAFRKGRNLVQTIDGDEFFREGRSETLYGSSYALATRPRIDETLAMLQMVERLSERDQTLVSLTVQGCTLEEIGQRYGVTESRICQLLAGIKETLAAWGEPIRSDQAARRRARRALLKAAARAKLREQKVAGPESLE